MDATAISTALCLIGILSFLLGRRSIHGSGVPGTNGNNGSARDLEQRAAEDNRQLADAERGTADTIREQAEDIGRAESNVKTAGNLIKRGKEILANHSPDK